MSRFAVVVLSLCLFAGAVNAACTASVEICDAGILSPKIQDGAVTTIKIKNFGVDGINIGDGAITTEKIADGAIEERNIVNDAISTNKLLSKSITGAKFANGAITAEKIKDNSFRGDTIANGAVTLDEIFQGDFTVVGEKIANGTIYSNEISGVYLNTDSANTVTCDYGSDVGIGGYCDCTGGSIQEDYMTTDGPKDAHYCNCNTLGGGTPVENTIICIKNSEYPAPIP